ncbi:MAG: hypothetical protein V3R33_04820 [Anaerolineales bacterium]
MRKHYDYPKYMNIFPSLILAIAVLTACGAPIDRRFEQSPLLSQLERKSGRIVYIGGDGNIYTMDQGGGKQQQITTDAHFSNQEGESILLYQAPTWSRDGGQIAFVGVNGSAGSTFVESASLYTASMDGLELVETFKSDYYFPFYLYWSPNDETIGFLSNTNYSRGLALFSLPIADGEAIMLDAGIPFFWGWAPDSQRMLVHAGSINSAISSDRMSLLRLNNNVVNETVLGLPPSGFQTPVWTTDGEHVLVAVSLENKRSLVLLDKDGNLERVLMNFAGESAFTISPDGSKVAIIYGQTQQQGRLLGRMLVFDIEDPRNMLTTDQDNVLAFFWSPDSEQIAYFPYDILNIPIPNEEGEVSESSQRVPVETVSVHIMDLASDGESHDITHPIMPTDVFLSMLSLFTQYQQSATIWSPDSQNLVISAHLPEGAPVIMIVKSSGSLEPRYLVNGVLAFWSWE